MQRDLEEPNKTRRRTSRRSLAELRDEYRTIAAREIESELLNFAQAHSDDPRAGAGALVARCNRQLAAIRDEQVRLASLFARRDQLFDEGVRWVAGIDEVGVGPLAGPVVAAAVILPRQVDLPRLNVSKKLRAEQRQELDRRIREQAIAVAVGEVPPSEIDTLNIYQASLEAMRRAVVALSPAPEHLLVDARRVPGVPQPQTPLVHGDAIDGSIAAASIVAKVHRDAIMCSLDQRYPGYGFARHMGYGTALHLDALERLGPTPIHRRSFGPVARAALPTYSAGPASS